MRISSTLRPYRAARRGRPSLDGDFFGDQILLSGTHRPATRSGQLIEKADASRHLSRSDRATSRPEPDTPRQVRGRSGAWRSGSRPEHVGRARRSRRPVRRGAGAADGVFRTRSTRPRRAPRVSGTRSASSAGPGSTCRKAHAARATARSSSRSCSGARPRLRARSVPADRCSRPPSSPRPRPGAAAKALLPQLATGAKVATIAVLGALDGSRSPRAGEGDGRARTGRQRVPSPTSPSSPCANARRARRPGAVLELADATGDPPRHGHRARRVRFSRGAPAASRSTAPSLRSDRRARRRRDRSASATFRGRALRRPKRSASRRGASTPRASTPRTGSSSGARSASSRA